MAWTAPSGHVWATGETVTAASMNTYIANDLTFLYGDAAWTAPTFVNSWTNFSGYTCGFRLIGTRVEIRGVITGGAGASTAFTLPTGYRPTQSVNLACTVSTAVASNLVITSAGLVQPPVGGAGWSSIEANFDTI